MARPRVPDDLRHVWDRIPDAGCRGLCEQSCGPIPVTPLEKFLIEKASGRRLSTRADLSCTLLVEGRCTAYDVRPLVCRLFGSADGLECPWGCRPVLPLLREEAGGLLADTIAASDAWEAERG